MMSSGMWQGAIYCASSHARLQHAAGEAFLARIGGDEFSLIVTGEQPATAVTVVRI
jgi:GGDEF domain-containing protein